MGSAPTPATRRVSGPVPSPPSGRPSRHHGNRPRGLVEENPCGFAPPRAGARAHHDRRGTGGVVEQGLNRGEQKDVFEHRHLPVLLPPRTQHVRQELHLLASQVARSFSGTAKGHSAALEGCRPRYPGHPTRPPPLSDPSARGQDVPRRPARPRPWIRPRDRRSPRSGPYGASRRVSSGAQRPSSAPWFRRARWRCAGRRSGRRHGRTAVRPAAVRTPHSRHGPSPARRRCRPRRRPPGRRARSSLRDVVAAPQRIAPPAPQPRFHVLAPGHRSVPPRRTGDSSTVTARTVLRHEPKRAPLQGCSGPTRQRGGAVEPKASCGPTDPVPGPGAGLSRPKQRRSRSRSRSRIRNRIRNRRPATRRPPRAGGSGCRKRRSVRCGAGSAETGNCS